MTITKLLEFPMSLLKGRNVNTKTATQLPLDCTKRNGEWVCYQHRNGLAYEIFNARTLDECREYARCAGFDGIVIGSPSVPWGN